MEGAPASQCRRSVVTGPRVLGHVTVPLACRINRLPGARPTAQPASWHGWAMRRLPELGCVSAAMAWTRATRAASSASLQREGGRGTEAENPRRLTGNTSPRAAPGPRPWCWAIQASLSSSPWHSRLPLFCNLAFHAEARILRAQAVTFVLVRQHTSCAWQHPVRLCCQVVFPAPAPRGVAP